jgi:PAS domain S-box-containing protein
MSAVLEAVQDGIIACGPDGTLTLFNRAMREFHGLNAQSFEPQHWTGPYDLLRPDGTTALSRDDLPLFRALAGEPVHDYELVLAHPGMPRRNLLVSGQPFYDEAGQKLGAVVSMHDISAQQEAVAAREAAATELVRREEAEAAGALIRQSEERLQQGLVAARMAVWERDPASGALSFAANLQSVFGKRWDNVAELWEMVHPDDRAQLNETIEHALSHGAGGGEYRATPRIRRADDGRWIWIDIRGRLGLGPDGRSTVVHAVAIDITERKHAEEALQLADRRKDEFLAMLAHELRNPLAPISSAADMLRIAFSNEPRVKQISEIVARQVAHMRHLVDDLLDVSRVTRGLVTISRQPTDLRRVVSEAVEQSRPLVDARRHQLAVALPDAALMADGDHTRLVQVAANLINNAAKYTQEGGRIEVVLARHGNAARLTVHDNGTGIAPELLPVVFDLFTQGSRTLDRAQGGLGLGLALVRKLVELHDGQVDASSPGLGQGSTFTITLPLI